MFLLSALVIGAASASPRRLVISGSTVASSEEPSVPIILKGFNFGFEQGALPVTEQDRNITSIFPGANLARLVMNHWHDKACCDDDAGVCDRPGCSHEAAVSGQLGGDCDSNNESLGFLTAPCLSMFDNVVQWFTDDVKGWVVLTARAALAAGDGGDGHTVFTNATLRKQMIAMWAFLARRYRNTSGVAGYEVMSEPRTKNDHEVVHRFQADACRAVWEEDPAAVCFLGPAPFYDRWHLGPDYLISGGPVVYVANFLCPNFWIKGAYKGVAYGESGRCCDIGNSKDCPTGCDTNITLNRAYLESQLAPIDDFRKKHNVSVWVDQWGVGQDIGGGSKSQRQYLKDILSLFEERQDHTSYWWYRDPSGHFSKCERGFEIWCKLSDGGYHWNEVAIQELGKYMSAPPAPATSVYV